MCSGALSVHNGSYRCSLTCKGRKLKCDEAKPACGNCIKASRDCTYGDQSIFRSQDICSTPRRKRTRSVNWQEKQQPTVFNEDHTWVEVPTKRKCQNPNAFYSAHNRQVTFVQVEDPWAPDNDTIADAEEDDTDRRTDAGVENRDPDRHELSDYGSVHSQSLQHVPTLDAPQEYASPIYPVENFDLDPVSRVIASHLMRHFQQGPGQWSV